MRVGPSWRYRPTKPRSPAAYCPVGSPRALLIRSFLARRSKPSCARAWFTAGRLARRVNAGTRVRGNCWIIIPGLAAPGMIPTGGCSGVYVGIGGRVIRTGIRPRWRISSGENAPLGSGSTIRGKFRGMNSMGPRILGPLAVGVGLAGGMGVADGMGPAAVGAWLKNIMGARPFHRADCPSRLDYVTPPEMLPRGGPRPTDDRYLSLGTCLRGVRAGTIEDIVRYVIAPGGFPNVRCQSDTADRFAGRSPVGL